MITPTFSSKKILPFNCKVFFFQLTIIKTNKKNKLMTCR